MRPYAAASMPSRCDPEAGSSCFVGIRHPLAIGHEAGRVAFLLEHSLSETNCGTGNKAAKAVIGNSKKDGTVRPVPRYSHMVPAVCNTVKAL